MKNVLINFETGEIQSYDDDFDFFTNVVEKFLSLSNEEKTNLTKLVLNILNVEYFETKEEEEETKLFVEADTPNGEEKYIELEEEDKKDFFLLLTDLMLDRE